MEWSLLPIPLIPSDKPTGPSVFADYPITAARVCTARKSSSSAHCRQAFTVGASCTPAIGNARARVCTYCSAQQDGYQRTKISSVSSPKFSAVEILSFHPWTEQGGGISKVPPPNPEEWEVKNVDSIICIAYVKSLLRKI